MNLSLPKTYFKFLFIAMLFIGQYANAQIAAWTFDTSLVAPNTPTSVTANFGNQSSTAIIYANGTNGSSTWITATIGNELTMFAGTMVNDPRGTAVAGSSYSLVGGTGNSANGKSIVLKFSMTGFENPVLTFATRGTGTGFNIHQWAWSIDNITYTNFGTNTANTGSTFLTRTLDLSSINDVDNASDVYLRLTVSGATNATGNNRLDNFVINASAVVSGPTVTTTAAAAISTTGADLNGIINANGTTTDASFEYGTTVAYGDTATATPSTATGTTATSISATIGSLAVNTLYHYRAVGTVSTVPTNGANLTFYTLASTPGVLAISNPQFTTLDLAVDATTANGNPSATEYAIQETGGQYVQANGSLGATAVWQTAAAWATTAVTGLTASTTYTFQVKARNGANLETSFGSTDSGTTLSPLTADFNIVQFPNTTQNITEGTSFTVYIRAYEDGITNLAGSSPRLKGWVGYSSTNDNPANAGWTWISATFNVQVGNDDEYQADIPGSLSPGTYYYAARFEIDDSTVYTYGGAGGNWNNNNITLTVNADVVDFANIQFPTTATITEGETVTVFAQVFEPSITPGAGAGAGITAEIGYSSTNTTPDGSWTWLSTTYNTDLGNNDEYLTDLGAGLTTGTYYYASRFIKTGSSTYVYGGTAGIWNNDSGVLTVEALGTPVATAGTAVGVSTFTANWGAITDATSYAIDVYEQTTSVATDLFISEYVEGSSNNKYIEIYNGTGASVDLANYDLVNYSNGSLSVSSTLALTGTLANNTTYVIRNTSAVTWGGTSDLVNNTVLGFNGNDVIALRYLGTNIDVLGTIGSNANFAMDVTLTRNSTILSPISTYNSSQWASSGVDTVSNLGSHTFAGGSSISFIIEDVNVGNITSYNVTGLNPETAYFYVVRAVLGANTSANSNVIEVNTLSGTCTWDGLSWSNGTGPTFEIDAILLGAYDTTTEGGFTAKSVTVSTGGLLAIGTATSVIIVNELNNELTSADVVISNDGSLIQQGTTNTNTGNVTVQRNSQDLMRLDYTMWSSPVAVQNLANFSPFTTSNRFYTYTTDTDIYAPIANTNDFGVGQGYLIRTPNNHPTTPTSWLGQFAGLPNSGDLSIGLSTSGNGYNLVGNPYPSPISIATLLSENNGVIAGNLYFWRKTNGANGSAYVTYSGGTFSDGVHAFDNIQPGQGFIVEAISAGSLSFTNTQRQTANGVFYRNENATQSEGNSRIWLNLNSNNAVVGQMAIGYNAIASNDLDVFDAVYINDSEVALNSFVADTALAVQHRAAFEDTDIVPLRFKTDVAGSYTIAINTVDGLFADETQTIFVKDNLLNIEHNLRSSAYNFISEIGTFTNRFEIVYESTLGVTTPDLNNYTIVFVKDALLNVQTSSATLSGIQVFDIQGRLVLDVKNINSPTYSTSLSEISNGVLVVRVITEDGIITTKKIIK